MTNLHKNEAKLEFIEQKGNIKYTRTVINSDSQIISSKRTKTFKIFNTDKFPSLEYFLVFTQSKDLAEKFLKPKKLKKPIAKLKLKREIKRIEKIISKNDESIKNSCYFTEKLLLLYELFDKKLSITQFKKRLREIMDKNYSS